MSKVWKPHTSLVSGHKLLWVFQHILPAWFQWKRRVFRHFQLLIKTTMARIRAKIIVSLWNWVTQQGRKIERLARAHHDPCCNTHTEICTRMSEWANELVILKTICVRLLNSCTNRRIALKLVDVCNRPLAHTRAHIRLILPYSFVFHSVKCKNGLHLLWNDASRIGFQCLLNFDSGGAVILNAIFAWAYRMTVHWLTRHTRHNFTYFSTNNIWCFVNGELDQRQIWLITLTFSPSATWLLQHAALLYSIVFIVTVLHIYNLSLWLM